MALPTKLGIKMEIAQSLDFGKIQKIHAESNSIFMYYQQPDIAMYTAAITTTLICSDT